ncbi:hypothetical protein HELRODRAFT_93299 [Helobdella robusta]|uniref:SSD domain-containing protein n=1 Tax=Helobdella robusta TaxID=6412 RepID=T1G8V1_HELRO|nr:hypothetical protein HELRODRAFT_93299 [Helobdella robusta]ESO12453.1 hypothetical protein HELRODRAFT_93299 [Helobdella robusta]
MPFLVLGIGVDDMLQLLIEWRKVSATSTQDERLSNTLRSAAVSITITSLTDLLAFCIGATSPFLSVRNFCACSGLGIFLCYMNQLTFFSGCIVLISRRSKCCQRKKKQIPQESLCLGNSLNSCDRKSFSAPAVGICETFSKYFSKYYPKILLHWVGKTITVIIFVAYVCMSIYGVTRLEEGLNLEALVPSEHYYRHHAVIDYKFFPNCGIVVTFVIHQPITYHEVRTQEKVHSFLKSVEASDFVVDNSSVSWLEAYNHSLMSKDKPKRKVWNASEFGKKLQTEFLPKNFQYLADVKFSKHAKSPWVIEASRFYVVCHRTNTSEDEKDLMLEMRKLASNSSLPMKAFSPNFVFYEHYASIVKNTLLPVGVTVIGMLFVALVFIPHPIAVTCVIGSMASVVVGMMGFMQLCSLALSAITTMQIILGVGICVSFTVRTSHAFMTATGKSRNERVTSALVKVGASILTGASCSSLSAFALYYGSSFIFASFFKTMAFALFLGVLHSIVFLPVMLSFVGPRRTGKPRLFIPTTAPSSTPSADSNVDSKEKNYSSCTSKEKLERKLSQESTTSKNSFNTQTVKPLKSSLSNLPRVSSKSLLFSNSKDDKISAESANSNDEEACTKNTKQHKVSFKLEDSLKPQTVQSSELSLCEKNCD